MTSFLTIHFFRREGKIFLVVCSPAENLFMALIDMNLFMITICSRFTSSVSKDEFQVVERMKRQCMFVYSWLRITVEFFVVCIKYTQERTAHLGDTVTTLKLVSNCYSNTKYCTVVPRTLSSDLCFLYCYSCT